MSSTRGNSASLTAISYSQPRAVPARPWLFATTAARPADRESGSSRSASGVVSRNSGGAGCIGCADDGLDRSRRNDQHRRNLRYSAAILQACGFFGSTSVLACAGASEDACSTRNPKAASIPAGLFRRCRTNPVPAPSRQRELAQAHPHQNDRANDSGPIGPDRNGGTQIRDIRLELCGLLTQPL